MLSTSLHLTFWIYFENLFSIHHIPNYSPSLHLAATTQSTRPTNDQPAILSSAITHAVLIKAQVL